MTTSKRYLVLLGLFLFTVFICHSKCHASVSRDPQDKLFHSITITDDDGGFDDDQGNDDSFDDDNLFLGPNDDPYFDDHDTPEPENKI